MDYSLDENNNYSPKTDSTWTGSNSTMSFHEDSEEVEDYKIKDYDWVKHHKEADILDIPKDKCNQWKDMPDLDKLNIGRKDQYKAAKHQPKTLNEIKDVIIDAYGTFRYALIEVINK